MKNYRLFLLPLTISLLAILLQALPLQPLLRFQADAISSGELWRLLTGHLLHLSWLHLWLNLAGLWVIWWLGLGLIKASQWLLAMAICGLVVSLGFLLFSPEIAWYVGLSGILHGLLAALALLLIRKAERLGWAMLLMLSIKLLLEQWQISFGTQLDIGGRVLVDAHLYGAVAGVGVGLYWMLRSPLQRLPM